MNEIEKVKKEVKLAQWAVMVRQRNKSGLTATDWCKLNGINLKTYYYTLKRIRQAVCNEIKKCDKRIDKLEIEKERLKKDNHIYLEALILSKHRIFGKSSEHTECKGQQSFFNEAETEYAEKAEEPVKKTVKGYTRKNPKTKRDELIKNIETEVIICTIPDDEQICPRCGLEMKVIGKKYIREEVELIPAKTQLGKAFDYAFKRREYLGNYFQNGSCAISNNIAENAIRPFAVGRKNWLFSDTPNGAKASADIYSIVETAKANGLDVFKYFELLLTVLPSMEFLTNPEILEELLLWKRSVQKICKNI